MSVPPRFELEEAPAPRLEAAPLPPAPEAPARGGTAGLIAAGAAVLAIGLAGLSGTNFIVAQFARSAVLGWLTLGVTGAGCGLIGAGIWRELAGLRGLRGVERIRADLASGDPARVFAAARAWLGELPEGAALLPALDALNDPDAALALLRSGVGEGLRARAEALGRGAAVQVFAATAAMPAPSLDALVVAWRGVRLVRQVAVLHGLRPGGLATLALLRRTVLAAATVAATDVALDTAARAAVSSPLLAHLAGDVAGAGVAARHMVVLARAAAAACSPLAKGR